MSKPSPERGRFLFSRHSREGVQKWSVSSRHCTCRVPRVKPWVSSCVVIERSSVSCCSTWICVGWMDLFVEAISCAELE